MIGGEFMTKFVKTMLPIAMLFVVYFFAASAFAATEPPDPCSLLTPARSGQCNASDLDRCNQERSAASLCEHSAR